MTATARATDPLSSHMAANEANSTGAVREQQAKWLRVLKRYQALGHKDATRSELAHYNAEFCWEEYRHDKRAHPALISGEVQKGKAQIGRRFPELAQHGLIVSEVIRKCAVEGRVCKAWRLTTVGKAAAEACDDKHRQSAT